MNDVAELKRLYEVERRAADQKGEPRHELGLFRRSDGHCRRQDEGRLATDLAIDAEADLCMSGADYFLQARLNVSVPGLDRATAQTIVDAAHQICPYSRAIRGNVEVAINVV